MYCSHLISLRLGLGAGKYVQGLGVREIFSIAHFNIHSFIPFD